MKTIEETIKDAKACAEANAPQDGWAPVTPSLRNSSTESSVEGALKALEMFLDIDAEAKEREQT